MRLARASIATQGAESSYKNLPDEPVDHALGHSRGGWTTKIHTLTDELTAPVTWLLSPGQAGDNPYLSPLLLAHRDQRAQQDQARAFRLLADKAYSHDSTRTMLRSQRIAHTIPQRSDQIARRKAKGSKGGRPPSFDPEIYRKRNAVERGYARLKQWRAIATRYDKYAMTYRGGVALAVIAIFYRTRPN